MSGVGRQGRRRARGISRSGRTEGTKNGETPAVACLGLDGQGPQAPNNQTSKVSRRLSFGFARRIVTDRPRPGRGSVTPAKRAE